MNAVATPVKLSKLEPVPTGSGIGVGGSGRRRSGRSARAAPAVVALTGGHGRTTERGMRVLGLARDEAPLALIPVGHPVSMEAGRR
jgi:hypothetical protein